MKDSYLFDTADIEFLIRFCENTGFGLVIEDGHIVGIDLLN